MSIWFKQTKVFHYQAQEPFTAELFEEKLREFQLQPCPVMSLFSHGWVSPFGQESEVLAHMTGDYALLAFGRQQRLLPASIIRQELDEKIKSIQVKQQRHVYAKEKASLREEIQAKLLPNAFCHHLDHKLFFDFKNQWLFISSTNTSTCEDIIKALKESLNVQIMPISVKEHCSKTMTQWLLDNRWPKNFAIEMDCDLLDPDNAKSQIRFVQQNLASADFLTHIQHGAKVKRLTLSWQERLRFTLDESFTFSRIQFLDILESQRQDADADNPMMVLDVDFSIMALSFSAWMEDLLAVFGGAKSWQSSEQSALNLKKIVLADQSEMAYS
jgi:recombination associated protein RdgC